MRRQITALAPLLALLGACTTTSGIGSFGTFGTDSDAEKVWAKVDGSYAAYGDFERAQSTCGIKDGLPDVAAAPTPTRAYQTCMRDQGWGLVAIE
jgi:hypothetical protein